MPVTDFSTQLRGGIAYWAPDRTYRKGHYLINPYGEPVNAIAAHISANEYDDSLWEGVVGQINVKKYGVVADGVTDDTDALNAIFSTFSDRVIEFPKRKTIKVSGPLTIPSYLTIYGNDSTIDGSSIPAGVTGNQQRVMYGAGSIGNSIKITGAQVKGDRIITNVASTSGFKKGDLVRVRNLQVSPPGSTHSSWTKGELNTVASIDSSTQLTLDSSLVMDYGDDGNLYIAKVTPLEDVTIKNLTIKAGGVGSTHTGLMLNFTRNLALKKVKVVGGEDNGIYLAHSYNAMLSDMTIEDSTSPIPAITNSGYGVVLYDACRYVTIKNSKFNNCRSFVNGGGSFPVSDVLITNNYGANCSITGFSSHEPCFNWTYDSNTVRGTATSTGFQFRGQYGIIRGNSAYDCAGAGIRVYCEEGTISQTDVLIEGNYVINCGNGILVDGAIITTGGAESIKYNITIVSNQVIKSKYEGILCRYFDTLTLTANMVSLSGSTGISLLGLTAGKPALHAVLTANTVKDSVGTAIKATYVNNIGVVGGNIKNAGDRGILFDTCFKTSITSVILEHIFANGIRIVNGAVHVISGVEMQDFYAAGNLTDGMAIITTQDVSVIGGIYTGSRYAINCVGTDRISIVGVNGLGAYQATKFLLDGSAVSRTLVGNLGTSSPAS